MDGVIDRIMYEQILQNGAGFVFISWEMRIPSWCDFFLFFMSGSDPKLIMLDRLN